MAGSRIARRWTATMLMVSGALAGRAMAAAPVDILTYHYDNFRTGWNQGEKVLTPRKVKSANFQMIGSTALDDQVDAQPLILGNQSVGGNSAREVVYIATESNTIYAIDGNTGAILLQKNFGTPVNRTSLPGQCPNGGPHLGINSTPTIDPATHKIYFIAYTFESHKPVYHVHAIDPSTLEDTVTPQLISASGKLSTARPTNSIRMKAATAPACCWPTAISMRASRASAISTPICRAAGSWAGRPIR